MKTNEERVEEFRYGDFLHGCSLYECDTESKIIEDWLLQQFKEIDQEWTDKIEGMKHKEMVKQGNSPQNC